MTTVVSQLQDFFDELGEICYSEYLEYLSLIPPEKNFSIGFHYNCFKIGRIVLLNYYRNSDQLALAA
jgi:hypothetical protein